jgi:hypothetical protein
MSLPYWQEDNSFDHDAPFQVLLRFWERLSWWMLLRMGVSN